MPCDAVAIVRCRIDGEAITEILASAEAQAVLKRFLEQAVGTVTLESKIGQYAVLRCADGSVVTLGKDGLTVRQGYGGKVVQAALEKFVAELGRAASQERVIRAIKRRYVVESDETDGRGNRAITLSL